MSKITLKKSLLLVGTVVVLVGAGLGIRASKAKAQAVLEPTQCPTDYVCSFLQTGALPLLNQPTDGYPLSLVGYLSFDNAGNVTGEMAVNANGTATAVSLVAAKCTSGTNGGLGEINISQTSPATQPLDFNFVTYSSSSGLNLLVSGSPESPAGSPIVAGVCHASFAG